MTNIVLVTGGTGLIGKAIERVSKEYKYKHLFIFVGSHNCDLTNSEQTNALFEEIKPDYVIHLAAFVGGLFKNMNHKVEMYEQNILINHNVLKYSHQYKVKKVVSCLSTCIFPDKSTYPIDESMLHNGPPHHSNDSYAYAKRMLEVQSKAYQQQYNDDFICVIPTNIYGPYDNYSLDDGHVIPALIHRCYINKQNKQDFEVKGTGKPLRQFIYSTDLAKLIIWTLDEYDKKESIILSVPEKDEVSIQYIAQLIAKCFDYEEKLTFNNSFSDGQYKKTACNDKLMQLIGEFKFTTIEQGIQSSVDWFIQNYENARK